LYCKYHLKYNDAELSFYTTYAITHVQMDESDEILWLVTHEGTIHYEEVNKLTSAFRAASKTTGLQVTG